MVMMSIWGKGEKIALSPILCICEYLDYAIGDIRSVTKKKKEETV